MSPPCQPFTRNNATDSRDMNDPRAKAFTHLIEILPKLLHPPNYIALEVCLPLNDFFSILECGGF